MSLNRAMEQLTAPWQQAHLGVELVSSPAGTQQLRAQIEGGAPADVLLSAGADDSDALFKAGLLLQPKPFVGNVLALGASPQNQTVKTFVGALQPGVKLVICDAAVPAGKCTAKALTALAGAGRAIGRWSRLALALCKTDHRAFAPELRAAVTGPCVACITGRLAA